MENEAIKLNHLDTEIRKRLVGAKQCCKTMPAIDITPIKDFSSKDFMQVFLISAEDSCILIKDTDYNITDTNEGARIDLATEYISSANTICVIGFTIGA